MTTDQFNKAFNEYYAPLIYFCVKLVGNFSDAEEIVSEVFQNFWKRNNVPPEKEKAFLFVSASNTCKNFIRNKHVQRRRFKTVCSHLLDDLTPEEERLKIRAMLYNIVCNEANKLPTETRRIFFMHFTDGIPLIKISRLINKNENTVRNALAFAVRSIKKCIPPYEYIISTNDR